MAVLQTGCSAVVARLHGVQEVVGSTPASPTTKPNTEESHSGLVRTLGKRVWGNSPRVRISPLPPVTFINYPRPRAVAQLVARFVRDEEAVGSSPASPTTKTLIFWWVFLFIPYTAQTQTRPNAEKNNRRTSPDNPSDTRVVKRQRQ